jgi:hypothetical protein
MSLKNLSLATRHLELPNGSITVRGLSLNEILLLVGLYKPAMEAIYTQVSAVNGDTDQLQDVVQSALTEMPDLVKTLIVMGCGEDVNDNEAMKTAELLDFGSQVQIINAVGEATFAAGGGAGNVLRLIVRAVQGTTSLLKNPSL